MSDDRPSAYFEGEHLIFRGSAVGDSAHALAASLAGIRPVDFSADAKMRMAEGVLHESDILERVAKEAEMDWSVHRDRISFNPDEQEEIDFPITNRIVVRLHPDGFLFTPEGHPAYVVEAKAMGRDVFMEWEKKGFAASMRYATQMSLEMYATGLPGVFARKNRDTGKIKWEAMIDPPVDLVTIRRRLMVIAKRSAEGVLDPIPEEKCQWGCRFFFLHDHEVGETVEDETIDSLAEMVARARERKQQAEEVEREARGKLREYLGEAGKRRTKTWSVAYREQEGRVTYDTKKMAEDGVDVEAYARKGKGYAVVTVKRLGKTGDGDEGAGA